MNKPFPPPLNPDPTLPSSQIPGIPGPADWSARDLPAPGAPQNTTPISLLPPAAVLRGNELVPVVQNGITCRSTASAIGGAAPGHIFSETLPITTMNVIPNLTYAPDGQMIVLFVNGQAFFAVTGDFTVVGNTITWASGIYSVAPGSTVVACYTHV